MSRVSQGSSLKRLWFMVDWSCVADCPLLKTHNASQRRGLRSRQTDDCSFKKVEGGISPKPCSRNRLEGQTEMAARRQLMPVVCGQQYFSHSELHTKGFASTSCAGDSTGFCISVFFRHGCFVVKVFLSLCGSACQQKKRSHLAALACKGQSVTGNGLHLHARREALF